MTIASQDNISGKIVLKKGREKPVRNRHPWLFSGAVARVEGSPSNGDLVSVVTANGDWLATAYYNEKSQIIGRIISWQQDQINNLFWRDKLAAAVALRTRLNLSAHTDAYRLINAEADGLPGLVVDRYGDWLVMQCQTLGIDMRKKALAEQLASLLKPKGIVERSDVAVRKLEGLQQTRGVLWGKEPPEELFVSENGIKFGVNLLNGHKTGLYLDQRDNREIVCSPTMVAGKDVLNVFSYTGGFGTYAAKHGAKSVVNIDSSVAVLEQADRNLAHNQLDDDRSELLAGDAFQILRDYRDAGRTFDVIILDPPKFVHSQRDIKRASRGYKDLNWLAMRMLNPNGLLATFSCSGLVSADLYQKIVFGAAVDANRDVSIVRTLTQAPCHPISLTVPESSYLKGFLCHVA